MKILAIIPARGGSKGIKRKNLVMINNKPLIVYSIEQALAARHVNRVIVSTDDEEIKNVSLANRAEVPFLRPKALAEDHVLDLPVFEHALNFLKEKEKYNPDIVVHLRPTAPYRKSKWIDEAISLLVNNPKADSVRSVSKPHQHPYRIFKIDTAKNFAVSIFKESSDLGWPNGLVIHPKSRHLMLVTWQSGKILEIDPSGNIHILKRGLKNLDGIDVDKAGNLYVSSFEKGEVYRIPLFGRGPLSVFLSGLTSPADISCDRRRNELLVPSLKGNTIAVYSLESTGRSEEPAEKK